MMSSESKDIDETLMDYLTMRCPAIIQQIVMMLIYKRLLRFTDQSMYLCLVLIAMFIREIRLD